jgi:predicted MFS family arabinose efflux permease
MTHIAARVPPSHPLVPRGNSKALFFVIEGVNGVATPYFLNYLFFLLRDRYGFGNLGNLATSALGGLVYALAAWLGGRFAQRFGYFTSLKVGFGGMAIFLASALLVPSLPTVLLAYVGCMAAVCFTWPALEALISDRVAEESLPKNIGIYNMVWAAGTALVYFVGGTLYETLGHDSILWLPALVHGGLYLFILHLGPSRFDSESPSPVSVASHRLDAPATDQPVSPATFLRMAWLAIPFSYVAVTTVIAFIPSLAQRLGMSTTQAGLFCSIWMFARMATFVILWQWTGWHYRFRWLLGAFVGLIASFSLLLLSTNLAVLTVVQIIFGVAVGLIYYSSLFYSMDVGETKGEHGGLHEAMIGAGICLGPAVGAVSLILAPGFPNAAVYAVTALLACGLTGLISLRVRRAE